jgi:AcrB/AcrD/AcrF family
LWWSQALGTETELWEKSYDVIVKIALRAPYTFTVLAVLLLIGGALSTLEMAKDIFPAINIPVVGIIWTYNGLPAQEMAERITTVSERALTTNVNNSEHIESNSFNSIVLSRFICSLAPALMRYPALDLFFRGFGRSIL